MRAIRIIGEGPTEEEFVNEILRPYLYDFGIYDVTCILLNTSKIQKGGDLKFQRYYENATRFLKEDRNILVTSLIDFYKLHSDFPKYEKAQKIIDKQERVNFLEEAISERIDNQRFIPYIQLHEFEGFLFSDIRGFDNDYIEISDENKSKITQIIDDYPNPELLNDGNDTAPSKRLEKLIPGYNKPLYGPIIAEEIGIKTIRKKCPRFNAWLDNIIKKIKTD